MIANIIKTQLFIKRNMTSKVNFIFMFKNTLFLRNLYYANIMKTQIYHKMKYDLKGHFHIIK